MNIFRNLFKKKKPHKLNKEWFFNVFPEKVDSRELIDKLHTAFENFAKLDVDDIIEYNERTLTDDRVEVLKYLKTCHQSYLMYQMYQFNNMMRMFESKVFKFKSEDLDKFHQFLIDEKEDIDYVSKVMEKIIKVL